MIAIYIDNDYQKIDNKCRIWLMMANQLTDDG